MNKLNELLALDVSNFTEKKNGLSYLSWANAWREFIKLYPSATYVINKDENGIPCFGNSELGYMVYTTVTVEELTHEMWLPVMNYMNKAIKNPDMFDVNKAIMRCLTKNLAMFGLGLYIYAGEDLPECDSQPQEEIIPVTEISPVTQKELTTLKNLAKRKGITEDLLLKYTKKEFKSTLEDMTGTQYAQLLNYVGTKEDVK